MSQPSFASDIRPLFTDEDVQHMSLMFDLSNFQEVKDNSDGILDRVARLPGDQKRMPKSPRDPWTKEQIKLFVDWIVGGFQP